MSKYSRYGIHRVISPKGVLPQAADILDATPVCYENECLIDVEVLNIDSASFNQIKIACNYDIDQMKKMIKEIVEKQGKMQNPITKSGGMLIGNVIEVGMRFHDQTLKKNDQIATLVSLSLTPLIIDEITGINIKNEQVYIKGKAILFDSGIFSIIPKDLNSRLVLAALDVCGAPAQTVKIVKENDTVLILGAAGKSGLLCAYQAKKIVGNQGRVIGLVNQETDKKLLIDLGLCDDVILGDATHAIETHDQISALTKDVLCDVVINVVNIPDTEMTSIICCKDLGIVYFFSMATSFTKAALGAEGIKKDVSMLIGNGYTKDHAEFTLNLMRESQMLHDLFIKRYASEAL